MKKIVIGSLVVVFVLTSCLKKATCEFDACGVVAPSAEIQAVQNYLMANGPIVATQHCSGLFYRIDDPGSGKAPDACSNVSVTYEGKLTNGTVFDQRSSPISFGLSGVIRAWQIGIPALRAGGRIHLYVPPSLGYGNQQNGSIPPNSILIFDVTLVAVQ